MFHIGSFVIRISGNEEDIVLPDKKSSGIPELFYVTFEEGFSYFINIILRVSTLPSVVRR